MTIKKYLLPIAIVTWSTIFVIALIFLVGLNFTSYFENQPNRLLTFTFEIWNKQSILEHGYLLYLTPDDFVNRKAYTGQSPFYLFTLYQIYKLGNLLGIGQRNTMALVPLISLSLGIAVFSYYSFKTKLIHALGIYVVCMLFVTYILSLPFIWITIYKYHVDNVLLFSLGILICYLTFDTCNTNRIYIYAFFIILAIICPSLLIYIGIARVLYGIFLYDKLKIKKISRGVAEVLIGALMHYSIYLWAKFLGLSSTSSSIIFRTGYDGSTEYFFDMLQSVLAPFIERPLIVIIYPIFICVVIYLLFSRSNANNDIEPSPILMVPYYVLMVYILNLLFFPQAISIHPYYYDIYLVTPFLLYAIYILSRFKFHSSKRVLTIAILLLLMINNNVLTILHSSNCPECRSDYIFNCKTISRCNFKIF